jgi:hypothetical protein
MRRPLSFIRVSQIVAKQAASGPSWAHELKHDGYRLQIHVRDGRNFSTRSIGTPSAVLSIIALWRAVRLRLSSMGDWLPLFLN